MAQRVLTGITPSGIAHLGNYIGSIKPALAMLNNNPNDEHFYFVADLHSLIKCHDNEARQHYTYNTAATWLALGLDPECCYFYRQSDLPEVSELAWILSTVAGKGLLNRAHAYKAALDANEAEGKKDPDAGVTMGLYGYPILMTADILGFNADVVPVGKDQVQHIEIARDIAARFNHIYGEVFHLPQAKVDPNTATIPGTDGRKMSKSYGNTIELFMPEKDLRKAIMKIKTNSQLPEEPKSTKGCTLYALYQGFCDDEDELQQLAMDYQKGIGWGEVKGRLFEKVNETLSAARECHGEWMAEPKRIDEVLLAGQARALGVIGPLLNEVKQACGLF